MFDIAVAAYYNGGNSGKRLYCAQKQTGVLFRVFWKNKTNLRVV
ncbi:hypothetical protein [Blautia sp.]|nr:hypothetical protein [Blautia sp.]